MSSVDPRTPVIVGAGQVSHRDRAQEPTALGLMLTAARLAGEDCARPALLERAQSVAAVDCLSWAVPDPARSVAAELGIEPAETVRTIRGGSGPVELLGDLAGRIAAGDLEVALMVGGEAINPFMRERGERPSTGWPKPPEGEQPTRTVGSDRPPSHPAEERAGLIAPIFYYPLFETAVRAAAGSGREAHDAWLARLWGRFAEVARTNPHAWSSDPPTTEQIATVSERNRLVAHPYPKLLTANIQVDQGAALLLCSAAAAEAASVPRERWTFVHASAAAHDRWFAAERQTLHRSPAIAACGRAALGRAGVGIDDVDLLDLYSCFPSAVQVAAGELGIDLEDEARPPTVTGGLTFAGGPASNYVTHAVATLCVRLREQGAGLGLATGVGWYLTKHGVLLVGAEPPEHGFAHHSVQPEVDALAGREVGDDEPARAAIEAYTAIYDREGAATLGIVSALDAEGRRRLARSEDRATVEALLGEDPLGATAAMDADGGFALGVAARAGDGPRGVTGRGG